MPNIVNPYLFAAPPAAGTPYVVSVSTDTYTDGGTTFDVALPPTYAAGDLLLAVMGSESGYGVDDKPTITGWTDEVYESSRFVNAAQFYSSLTIVSKVATASESAPTFTSPYNAVGGEARTVMLAIRDWGSVGASSTFSSESSGITSTTLSSVTTANNNALVLYMLTSRRGVISSREYTPELTLNAFPQPAMYIDSYSQSTAGASPTNTMTFSTALQRRSEITLSIEP